MVATDITRVWAILESVPDPEIPVVSIRELGILRGVQESGGELHVIITPTYSGCPAMGQIEDDIHAALAAEGIQASIVTRLSPAWTTDWMTDCAKDKLRAYGIAPPHTVEAEPLVVLERARRTTACPFCGSSNTEEKSEFGSTACKAIHFCNSCHQPFDSFKSI